MDPTAGDFIGNQVLAWTPLRFTVEFLKRLRAEQDKLANIPTVRQAIAMAKLMVTMYHRKASLLPLDFINAAVLTTPVEDQAIARRIATEILFPAERPARPAGPRAAAGGNPPVKDLLASTDEFMADLLGDLASAGLDLDGGDGAVDVLDQAIQAIDDTTAFVDDLYARAARGESPASEVATFFEHRGGFSELLLHGIASIPAAVEHARRAVQRDANTLSPREIQACGGMGLAGDVMANASNPWVTTTARFVARDPGFTRSLDEVLAGEDVAAAARTLDHLARAGFNPAVAKDMVQRLVERARDLFDVAGIAKVTGSLPPFDVPRIVGATLARDPASTFATARALDAAHGSDTSGAAWDQWRAAHPSPTVPDLFQAQVPRDAWATALRDAVQQEIRRITAAREGTPAALARLARTLHDLGTSAAVAPCKVALDENAATTGRQALDASGDTREFLDTLRDIVDGAVPVPDQDALQAAMAKNVPVDAVLAIIGSTFDVLKRMYEQGGASYKRYASMLDKLPKLGYDQMEQLERIAVGGHDAKGMAALGLHDLGMALDIATRLGGSAVQAMAGSLTAGPGENLLLQWFTHRARIPKEVRDLVRRLTRDTLVTLALDLVARHRGTSEKGIVPSNQIRPYLDGDELDNVDIDATIENIIGAGKTPDMITSDDLLVTNTQKGRAALCFLLDISGSMSGEKLASCALCTVMVIGKLQPEEVAVALFESNTHVVKAFDQERELGEVADELLDLHARGGTRAQRALEWARGQLVDNDAEYKACFMLTDCEFFEGEAISRELEPLGSNQVRFVLAVHGAYNQQTCKRMLDTTRGELLPLTSYKRMPQAIAELLERIG